MKTHKELDVWQKSMKFVTTIYKQTQTFPGDEKYGLTNQIRRSAISVPSNIAEGAGRETLSENLRFLFIARGSLTELDTQLLIAKNLGYLSLENFEEMNNEIIVIGKKLNNLINYFKTKTN